MYFLPRVDSKHGSTQQRTQQHCVCGRWYTNAFASRQCRDCELGNQQRRSRLPNRWRFDHKHSLFGRVLAKLPNSWLVRIGSGHSTESHDDSHYHSQWRSCLPMVSTSRYTSWRGWQCWQDWLYQRSDRWVCHPGCEPGPAWCVVSKSHQPNHVCAWCGYYQLW